MVLKDSPEHKFHEFDTKKVKRFKKLATFIWPEFYERLNFSEHEKHSREMLINLVVY